MFREIYNSFDEIPEDLKDEYKEVTKLIEGEEKKIYQHKAFAGLSEGLELQKQKTLKEREENAKLLERLNAFEQEKQKALEQKEQERLKALEESGDKTAILEDKLKRFETEFTLMKEDNERLKKEKTQSIIAREAASLAAKVGTKLGSGALSMLLQPRFKVGESGEVIILSKNGEPTSMDIKDLEIEIKEDPFYASMILDVASSGGNGKGGAVSSSIKNPFKKDSFNLTEQARLKREDPAMYEKLKAAAN